ncbi:MAG TPA: RNA polymerase sigma factor [Candidatus Paceibacterota bacterium]|nr:RNA polymerase sigma factor [Verrucomicrobiota bacterium]HRY49797.1 RNA polymerase sigma factor [Candidatus Paceibacterota bacterium]
MLVNTVEPSSQERIDNDHLLLQRVREGDEDAARDLVQRLYPLVIKLVRSRQTRMVSEDDLVQMVFTRIFAKLDQFSGQVPLEHWVSRIAINTCLNQIARERVRPEFRWSDLTEEQERVIENLTASANELPASEQLAARELVEKLLEHLKPEERLVITLLHLESRSIEDIRKMTGWSSPLIKVRAFRARQKLKKHLQLLLKEPT